MGAKTKPPSNDQIAFELIAKKHSQLLSKLQTFKTESESLIESLSSQFFEQEKTIDRDNELELIFDAIDLNRTDDDNDIDSIINKLALARRLVIRLKEQIFNNKEQYDKGKYILFRLMKENESLIKQVFMNSKIDIVINETH